MTGTERKRVVATTQHLKRAALHYQRNMGCGTSRRTDSLWLITKGVFAAVLVVVTIRMVQALRTLPPPQAAPAVAGLQPSPVPAGAPAASASPVVPQLPTGNTPPRGDALDAERPAPEPATAVDAGPSRTPPDYCAMYKAVMDRHLARMRPPATGKTYTVALSNGKTVTGKLASADADTVVLDVEHGRLKLRRKDIQRKSWPELFPRQAARIIARHELVQAMMTADVSSGSTGRKVAREALANSGANPESSLPWTTVAGTFPFAPEVLQAWLKATGRSAGISVAHRMQAQKDRDNMILWLTVTDQFLMLEPERQASLAASIEGFWSSQCHATGSVQGVGEAVAILMDTAHAVVGGNTAKALQMTVRANGGGLRAPAAAAILDEDPGT